MDSKIFVCILIFLVINTTGCVDMKPSAKQEFSIDLQDGFMPRMQVQVLVEGKTIFDKEVQSNEAGIAAIIPNLTASKTVVPIEVRIPSKQFSQTIQVDLNKGKAIGIIFYEFEGTKRIDITQSDNGFGYD